MNVLFLAGWYPTLAHPVGGVFVREHAKAVSLYDNVVVVASGGSDHNPHGLWRVSREEDDALSAGIRTYRVNIGRPIVPKTGSLIEIGASLDAFRRVRRDGFHPDIIHAHVFGAGFIAALLKWLYGLPYVVTEHWSGFPRGLVRGVTLARANVAFRNARYVLPVSKILGRAIRDLGIRTPFEVIPNAVDLSLFHPPSSLTRSPEPIRLLFVGLLSPDHIKGVPHLLQALGGLTGDFPPWRLDIIGGGDAQGEYESLAARLGLRDRVVFHGYQPKSFVAEQMRNSDLFVLPSLWENLPCVAIEALASGLPVLSTRVGGIPELVSSENGLLVAPGDTQGLQRGLAELVGSLRRYDRTRIAKDAHRYSHASVGAAIHRVYLRSIGA
ncbi:MAG TPA: glycosyltransferase [Phycisphaerae bacterium]|nr:glycosyltransferase [Phycisphaerae bacterium]